MLMAGPILRRVEPGLVSVWVATSEPCKVRVELFRGVVDGPGATPMFKGDDPPKANTIKAGDRLHVAVAVVRLPDTQKLVPDQLYSYNVQLTRTGGGQPATSDLRSLGLLVDKQDAGKPPHHLALGFNQGRLPSFALPPLALEDLVLIHGSCRRAAADGPDAMAFIDDTIARSFTEPRKRPHLLMLTGDQIYADDVSPFLLAELNPVAQRLISVSTRDTDKEALPILDKQGKDSEAEWRPCDFKNFPNGKRTLYCDAHARFTSQDREQHLLSFGEYAAMYLLGWSNELWSARPDPKALTAQDPVFVGMFEDVDAAKTPWLFDKVEAAERAKEEAKLSPTDLAARRQKEQEEKEKQKPGRFIGCRNNLVKLQQFYDALPKVRRALANVPTLMIFDDHEITDDWNIVQRFKLEVYSRPAGRAIVRNGLVAYALFQAWGNNPLDWIDDGKNGERTRRAKLLEVIDGATLGGKGWGNATAALDDLLDLRTSAAPTAPAKAPVRWHFRYRASRFELLVLDSRTRRYYPGTVSPAGLIDEAGLKDQLPNGPADTGIEAVLVVAPCPVIGPSLMDELVQPAALHVLTMLGHLQEPEEKKGGKWLRTRAKFLDKDPEPWGFEPGTFEALLARLEAYATGRPVIFLSGDVHYAAGAVIDYWKGSRPTRFIQLTASAFKNQPVLITIVDPPLGQRALTEAIKPARVGWKADRPVPWTVPAGKRVPSSQIRNLNRSPLLLAADGWPEGTQVTRAPDWAWRYVPVLDERPEANDAGTPPPTLERRPAIAGGMPTPVEVADKPDKADFEKLAERHALQVDRLAPRRVVFSNNFGMVRFAAGPQGPSVRHEVHYQPRAADPAQGTQPHTVFVIALKTPPSATPPSLGKP